MTTVENIRFIEEVCTEESNDLSFDANELTSVKGLFLSPSTNVLDRTEDVTDMVLMATNDQGKVQWKAIEDVDQVIAFGENERRGTILVESAIAANSHLSLSYFNSKIEENSIIFFSSSESVVLDYYYVEDGEIVINIFNNSSSPIAANFNIYFFIIDIE